MAQYHVRWIPGVAPGRVRTVSPVPPGATVSTLIDEISGSWDTERNKNETPAKGPSKRSRVDATKVVSPCVNARTTGQHPRPCKKIKGLGKHGKLEDNQGATELRRPQTPINLFEDECVFCHSFRTTERFHGPMVRYREGRIVSSDEGNLTNAKYVHQNCMVWAPQVFFDGDKVFNMEKEIKRASTKNCSRCRLPGAALGCYHKSCRNTYHVPCAVMILDRWDVKNFHVLCPKHALNPLPCDELSSPMMESATPFPIPEKCEDQQVNQPDISSSSLPQGQCLDKEEISAHYRREEKQMNKSGAPVNQWVLLGSVLSAAEKDSLKEFASLTSSTLAEEWDKNVTHVIVGRNAGTACGRSYEVLMAILSGKWVVKATWIVDCLAGPIPGPKTCLAEPITVPEISYEVAFVDATLTSIGGPKRGRAVGAKGEPKLLSGLYFCLSAYMNQEYRENIENLIAAAEGQVLEGINQPSLQDNQDKNPAKVYFLYDGGLPRDQASTLSVDKEIEAIKYVAPGVRVVSHLWLFGAIACYDARMLDAGM
ncbi:unnamed protein product [Alopecurus aequalis]